MGNAGSAAPPTLTNASESIHARTASLERPPERLQGDFGRRFSTALTPTGFARDGRRDEDRFDYFTGKAETAVRDPVASRASSPPSAPQVPAFGGPLDNLKRVAHAAVAPVFGALAPAATPMLPVEKLYSAAPTLPNSETSNSTPQVPFQPPRGPKADRVLNVQGSLPREPRAHVPESWQKPDSQPRPVRAIVTPVESKPALEARLGGAQPGGDGRDSASGPHWEGAAFQGIPTGPRASTTPNIKPRPSPMQNVQPITPTVTPNRQPAPATSPVNQRPVGPPSARMLQPRAMGGNQWLSPDYKPPRPSIMNTVPTKSFQTEPRDRVYNPQGPRVGGFNQFQNVGQKPRIFQHPADDRPRQDSYDPPMQQTSARLLLQSAHTESNRSETMVALAHESEGQRDDLDGDLSGLPLSMEQSSEDEGEEDDGLDEDYFAVSEERFLRDMKSLSAKRPAPPLEDPMIVGLLLRIQMLSMIKDGAIPEDIQKSTSETEPEPSNEVQAPSLLSAKTDEDKMETPQQIGRFLREAPVYSIPTPPLEDLPFLTRPPLQGHVFEQWEQEYDPEDVAILLQQDLEKNAWDIREQLGNLHHEFVDGYRKWKTSTMDFERYKYEENGVTPVPVSPPLSVGQAPSLTPLIERTRGAKNTTELDLQNILKASEQSAREEQEKRDREATARPNYDLEAVVPSMLDPQEVESTSFEDTNQLIPPSNALEIFAFVPPQDDFTPEEQKIFIHAFCQSPKKWGKISESLPGRNYRQCILHYYLTKDVARYKEYWRKTLPRKGRRKGGGVSQRRSNALMAYDGEESENVPAAVTDTGRPRRAAAPTFGDSVNTDADASLTTVSASRRLMSGSRDGTGEPNAERPAGRGRKAGTGTKPRKSKAPIQPAQQVLQVPLDLTTGPSPVKVERALSQTNKNAKVIPRVFGSKAEDLPALEPQYPLEQDLNRSQVLVAFADAPMNPNGLSPMMTSTGAQPSSYWSVPEQQKFPALIRFFGKDFDAIANFMKTKTVTMVCF